MGGDLLWHNTVWASAAEDGHGHYDFDPMFAGVRSLVTGADVALCHEEVPFAAPGQPPQNFPVFAAPPEAAAWIGSFGFDGCTTASNHSLDQGYDGLVRTADLLERAGVAHIGTFRSRAERRRPVLLTTAAGVRIGVVAGTFGTNGFPLPAGREWSVSLWDVPNLLAQAHAARAAGADVVVVHLHGGDEYSHQPNAAQTALVERLTRSPDVDLVLGDHAHVVQPITKVHGKWVVYGMGNMVAQQDPAGPTPTTGSWCGSPSPSDAAAGSRSPGRRTPPSGGTSGTPVQPRSAWCDCAARRPMSSRRTSRGWAGSDDVARIYEGVGFRRVGTACIVR